jgi:alcohol dehydrogenase class IV
MGVDDPGGIGDRLDGLAAELGLELRLSTLGVPRSDLVTLAQAVNAERLGNNPVSLTSSELLAVLEVCW